MTSLTRRAREDRAVAHHRANALVTVSHEMREPLNGVIGMTRLLRDTALDAEQTGYLESIEASAQTLLELVNDLLDVSRIDAGALALADSIFSPARLAQGIVAMLRPRAATRGLAFDVALAADLPNYLQGDAGRLRQVIINLATNALKFTAEGEVRVTIGLKDRRPDRATLVIEVVDTGIGLDAATRDRLSEAFVQGDASIVRLYGGSGLGLSITRRLVEAMGGGLSWDSRPGGGSRFCATCTVKLVPDAAATLATGATLKGASLLLVDRHEEARATTSGLARLWGMSVRTARGGREALTLLHEAADRGQPFDVLITEGPLADMSAEELACRIAKAGNLGSTRLIVQTAAGMRGDAASAKQVGFAAYLPKSVSADMLRACLQQVIAVPPDAERPLITVHGLVEGRRPLSVLVVDDNPVNRRLASIMLERAGHRISVAEDGAQAVASLEAATFDVVLMDVQMPGMDGMEAVRRIRRLASPAARAVPIVALTANATKDADLLCREAGMDDYITKPIDGALLVAVVERLAHAGRRAL